MNLIFYIKNYNNVYYNNVNSYDFKMYMYVFHLIFKYMKKKCKYLL